MSTSQKMCIIVYSLVIIQCSVTMTIIFLKTKRTLVLYSLCMVQMLVILWLLFGMIENMSRNNQELLFSVRFTLLPISFIGGFGLLFALFYAEIITLKNKVIIGLIFAPLVITYLPTLTQKYFYLTILYKSIENTSITEWGIFFKINLSITHIYIILSLIIIVTKSIKNYKILKKKIILILLATVILVTINILSFQKIVDDPGFDITPASFSIFFLLLSIAIFKYKFLDVVQYATIDIFQNTEEAMLILDTKNNIVEFNKTTQLEFNTISFRKCDNICIFFNGIKGDSTDITQIVSIMNQINDNKVRLHHSQFELIDRSNQHERKLYDFYLKTIQNNVGEDIGKIISLKNKTESSKVMLENERSRISRDVHDNLSNMINVVSMNLEYAARHYENKDEALPCINTAYEVAKGIRINLRRILEELAPLDIEKVGLLNALESMFKKVIGTGTQIDFTHIGVNNKVISRTRHGYVIYKTCMEAINNAFFSGKAKKISIVLTYKDNIVRLLITDDGIGCDSVKKGRGLIGMEKRIQALGGSVVFDSAIDEGFNISVELPF